MLSFTWAYCPQNRSYECSIGVLQRCKIQLQDVKVLP
uniref:Uncharacterized protein n=1 Tax=Anguilla anguilla TaxID=7936 RepID=A0A0E9SH73_ANGAN